MEKFKTLDGKEWNKEDILFRMNEDDFYYNYLGKNALSSSSVTKLLSSPREYNSSLNGETERTPALEFGWLFHTSILEPDVYNEQGFVHVKSKNTKLYKEALEKHGRAFTTGDARKVEKLADSFYNNPIATRILQHARTEVPAVGYIFGLPFRAKADILGDGYVADIKTTSKVRGFKHSAYNWNYDSQCYIYCNLFDVKPENFAFIALDKESGLVGIVKGCSEDFYNSGKDKVERACETYREYFIDKEKDIGDYYLDIYL